MFDIAESHNMLSSVLMSDASLTDGIARLVDFCATKEPWTRWAHLGCLDFDSDLQHLEQWLHSTLIREPPPDNVKAYWFGLFNPVIDGVTTSDMYISGATDCDPSDTTFEWACGPSYFPEGRYAQSRILDNLYRSVDDAPGTIPTLGEYVLCLGYCGLALKTLTLQIPRRNWLGEAQIRTFAAGFDSGDGVLLGHLTKEGWQNAG